MPEPTPPTLTRHHYLLALGLFLAGVVIEFAFLGGVGWLIEHFYQLGPTPIDAPVLQGLESHRQERFNDIMLQITALGSVTVLTLLVILVFVSMILAKHYRTALSIVVAAVGASVLLTGMKHVVDRPRPFTKKADVVTQHLDRFVGDTHSFPSGHSMGSMAIYLMLGLLLAPLAPNRPCARFILGAAVGVPLLIGLSRLYLGVHYPTDVLCGWIAGALWAYITLRTFRVLDPAREWLVPGGTKPGA
jgi:membrane-associated phospholipid phosphatase